MFSFVQVNKQNRNTQLPDTDKHLNILIFVFHFRMVRSVGVKAVDWFFPVLPVIKQLFLVLKSRLAVENWKVRVEVQNVECYCNGLQLTARGSNRVSVGIIKCETSGNF